MGVICFRVFMGRISAVGAVLLATAWAGLGCRRDVAALEETERRHPDLVVVREAQERGDWEEVERRWKELLRRKADWPLVHFEYARFLDERGERPLAALYHYMRYQELRPEAEKNEVIGRRIRQLAGEIGGSRALRVRLEQAEARVAALEEEKARLLAEMAVMHERSTIPAAGSPWTGPSGPSFLATISNRFYRVKPGDTLIRIAETLYGDGGKAAQIFEANRSQLKSMDAIRVGQVLVIPP